MAAEYIIFFFYQGHVSVMTIIRRSRDVTSGLAGVVILAATRPLFIC